MKTSAIIMMIISMVFLWGGLILSILHLMKNPEELDDVLEDVKDQHTLQFCILNTNLSIKKAGFESLLFLFLLPLGEKVRMRVIY